MKLLTRVAIFFYVLLIMLIGLSGLLLLAHQIDLGICIDFLTYLYKDPQAALVAGVIIAGSMLVSLALARIIYGRQEKESIISFDNPLGRVTISLSALEDLVRRMVILTPQIKEIRPSIVSTKKGLNIEIRLVLGSDVNIAELTADLQGLIKRKLQDVIGVDERILIRIHVVKIAADFTKSSKNSLPDYDDEAVGRPLPFPGYKV